MSAHVGRLIQTPFGQVSVTCTVEQAREIQRQADAKNPGILLALRARGVWALGSTPPAEPDYEYNKVEELRGPDCTTFRARYAPERWNVQLVVPHGSGGWAVWGYHEKGAGESATTTKRLLIGVLSSRDRAESYARGGLS